MLETEKTFGLDPERFLTSLRAGLLQLATDKRSRDDQAPVRLACALARQCYINEYIYDVQPDETERAAALRARIARALANKGLVSPLELAVAAAISLFGFESGAALATVVTSSPTTSRQKSPANQTPGVGPPKSPKG